MYILLAQKQNLYVKSYTRNKEVLTVGE